MMKREIFIFILCSLLLVYGCEKIPFFGKEKPKPEVQPPIVRGTVIAKVDDLLITLEELNLHLDVFNASIDLREDLSAEEKKVAKIDTHEKKVSYVKEILIRQRVLYQAALDRGLDHKEEIVEILERDKIAILAREMQNEIIKNIDVSSTEIEQVYEESKELFKEPEIRRIREIVTKTEEEAREVLIELYQGTDFTLLAKTRSIANSAEAGGSLGEIKKGDRGEEFFAFDEIAFSPTLLKDSIAGPFKGPEGYYIIKVEEIKEGKQVSLTDAWEMIKGLLLRNKQKEELDRFYSRLLQSGKIRVDIYEKEIK